MEKPPVLSSANPCGNPGPLDPGSFPEWLQATLSDLLAESDVGERHELEWAVAAIASPDADHWAFELADFLLEHDLSGRLLMAALAWALTVRGEYAVLDTLCYRRNLPANLSPEFARAFVEANRDWTPYLSDIWPNYKLTQRCWRALGMT